MYNKSFYISEFVGNNFFSIDKRKNKKLYVPSLKEINNLEEIKIGDKIAFEDFDFKGILSSNVGLENFYKILIPHPNPLLRGERTIPIYLFDNHNHAYYFWYLARKEGIIGNNNILYHIDEHADMRDSGEYLIKPDSLDLKKVFDFTNNILNVGNYIIPAQKEGIIGEVIQIRNETNLENYLLTHPGISSLKSNGRSKIGNIILNLDLDFFREELDYIDFELKKKVILDIVNKAQLITVSSSPFFINQGLAIKRFKEIFG